LAALHLTVVAGEPIERTRYRVVSEGPEEYVNHRIALTATAIVVFLTAPAAQAGTIQIEFDLSSSVISILGGILTIPPDGSITSSTATVTIQGNSNTAPVAGAASLSDLSLQATVNGTVGGIASITGNIAGTQVGAATGALTGGLSNLALGTLTLNLSALINCAPAGSCTVLGTFPISVMSQTPITGAGGLGVGGLGTLSNATLNAILSVTIGGNSALISLIGQEISRTFTPTVPEPGTFVTISMGLLGLAAFGSRRDRA
jgi:hypothetical protein